MPTRFSARITGKVSAILAGNIRQIQYPYPPHCGLRSTVFHLDGLSFSSYDPLLCFSDTTPRQLLDNLR
jgi:hypothetical protein